MIAAGDPLGDPSGQDTDDDTRYDIHGRLLMGRFGVNARAQGPFQPDCPTSAPVRQI
jgi:hypothetical protein